MNLYEHKFSILYTGFQVGYCRLGLLDQFRVSVKNLVIVNLGVGAQLA